MSKTNIDTGIPPSEVTKRKRIQDLILSGEDPGGIDNTEVKTPPEVAPRVDNISYIRVKIRHDLYTLHLPALDVSVAEHQVAIRLPNNGVKFEPSELNGDFVITHMNSDYKVAYLGGIFEFPGDNSWVIAFIRDKRDEEED